MTTYTNCTPHTINHNDGRSWAASGILPRVSSVFTDFVDDVAVVAYGDVTGMPAQQDGVKIIVSAMVLDACLDRTDLVAPATGHDDCIRKDGRIVSVPGFVVRR